MGIWDFISWTSDSVRRNTPDLTDKETRSRIRQDATNLAQKTAIYRGAEAVKNFLPVERSGRKGEGEMGICGFISWISNSVRRNTPDLRDQETRSRIRQVSTNLAKNTVVYGGAEAVKKFLPGGQLLCRIVSDSFRGGKKFEGRQVEVTALQAKVVKLEKEIMQLVEIAEKQKPCAEVKSENASDFTSKVHPKPEDVIRVLMMKESIGRLVLDDLMVPKVGSRKNPK